MVLKEFQIRKVRTTMHDTVFMILTRVYVESVPRTRYVRNSRLVIRNESFCPFLVHYRVRSRVK